MRELLVWDSEYQMRRNQHVYREHKIKYLTEMLNLDEEMLDDLSDEELVDIIDSNEDIKKIDMLKYDDEVRPMIDKQTNFGKVLVVGDKDCFSDDYCKDKDYCCAIVDVDLLNDIDALNKLDIFNKIKEVTIWSDDKNIVTIELTFDDDTSGELDVYAYPNKDEVSDFMLNFDSDDRDLANDVNDGELESHLDKLLLPNLDNNARKIVFKESLSRINEVKEHEPKKLVKELNEIKKLANSHGFEYFTAMPFTAYDNDPESIEFKYPHFFKVVKAFFKEMGIIDKDSIDNDDVLDNEWYEDIDKHDWDTIIRVCEKLISNKDHSQQIEKVFKDNWSDGLDDNKILLDRERDMNDDFFEESYENEDDIDIKDFDDDSYFATSLIDDRIKSLTEDDDVEDEEEITVWPWGDPNI